MTSSPSFLREGASLLVDHLVSRGIVTAGDVLSEQTSFRIRPGRNLVFEARIGDLELVVKQYRPAGKAHRGRREAAFYRLLLSAHGKPLRAIAPRCFDFEDRSRRLVTERIRGGEDGPLLLIHGAGEKLRVWTALGKRLRALHSHPVHTDAAASIPTADRPFFFEPVYTGDWLRPRTPQARAYLRFLRSQRSFQTLLSRARSGWRDRCLIHSDLRLGNVVVISASCSVKFVDWESFGLGDPRWDLAKLLASIAYCRETFDGGASREAQVRERILRGYGIDTGPIDKVLRDFSALAFLQFGYEDFQAGKRPAAHRELLDAALSLRAESLAAGLARRAP